MATSSIKKEHTAYSYTEQIDGTWLDGNPIYRKTFHGTSGAGITNVDISSCNINQPVRAEFVLKNSGNGSYCFDNYMYNSATDFQASYMNPSKTTLIFRAGTQYAFGEYWLTLWYTKNS